MSVPENSMATLPKPDLSLLRDITPSVRSAASHLAHYNKDQKHLYYIGSKHSADWDNKSHDIIEQAFVKHQPQLVILEGIETERGISPHLGFDFKKQSDVMRYKFQSEENFHTAEALRARKSPFIGGEPSPKQVFQKLEQNGYSTKEIMAMFLVASIPIWRRSKQLGKPEDFPKLAENYFNNNPQFAHIPVAERLTFEEFNAIYESHKKEMGNKNFLQLTEIDVNGSHALDANYFQKMNALRYRFRDEHLATVIADALEKNDKVMVVYGNAHQYTMAPVFEQMFGGKSITEKLVLDEVNPTQVTQSLPATVSDVPAKNISRTPTFLKYGGVALAAAGVTAVVLGALPVVGFGLLAAGGVVFGSGAVAASQVKTHPSLQYTATDTDKIAVTTNNTQIISDAPSRIDGKSWTETTNSKQQQANRSL